MNSPDRPWPPLIVAGQVSRLVKWRDILLTSILWICFIKLIGIELEMTLDGPVVIFDSDWPLLFARLGPFFLVAVLLIGALVVRSVRTMRGRGRSLLLPQPAPLEVADQAHRAGLEEAALIAARDRPIVIVHVDADNRHRIEPSHG